LACAAIRALPYASSAASPWSSACSPSSRPVVKDYIAEIQRIQPTGPYHLLGWSFGAVGAYAIAASLQQTGHMVASLTLLDGYPVAELQRCGIALVSRDVNNQRNQPRQKLLALGPRNCSITSDQQLERVLDVILNNGV
jgi:thioesterase domain-containing protein